MQQHDVNKFFEGKEVVEADSIFTLLLRPEDIEAGIPGDPLHCAYAKSCERQFGLDSRGGLFYKDIAYIDFGLGGPLMRHRLSAKMREVVETVDRGDVPQAEVYKLLPVSESQRLDHKRKRNKLMPKSSRKVGSPRVRASWTVRGSEQDGAGRA